jgi:hypothetical protein
MNHPFKSTFKIMISMVMLNYGPEHARVLIFLERAAIETTVLEKGRMEACSGLRGEKWVSLKPPMDAPAIMWSCESHNPRSYHKKELALTKMRSGSAF